MTESVEHFHLYREQMNQRILDTGNLETKRFFGLDSRVFKDGKVSSRTKELCGLAASLVLRCDDCVRYHLDQCIKAGLNRDELVEVMNIALIVGGSIVIPHLRRAHEFLDQLEPTAGSFQEQ
ncbi:MAG: carboxymuconolactone decarboxylase family protein [FCB group bacterium]|nr:carboxymuconolactone decarboxylase family protein [FCB group bacterium]